MIGGDPEKERALADSAATIYRWLDSLKYSSPQVYQIFDAFYDSNPHGAVESVIDVLGYKSTGLEAADVPERFGSITDWFEARSKLMAPEASVYATATIAVESLWCDPPAPAPNTPFKVVWQEKNVGSVETGAYKAAVVNMDSVLAEVDFDSLAPDAAAQRSMEVPGLPNGRHFLSVYSPWHGSVGSTLQTQAGYQSGGGVDLAIGEGAAGDAAREQQEAEINSAINAAIGHLHMLNGEFDTAHIKNALQALALVAPSLDSSLDLMGKATQMMARDPATVGPEARDEAKAKANDAIVALTAAQTRTFLDNASPVDHPAVVEAATLTAAIADVVSAAPEVSPSA